MSSSKILSLLQTQGLPVDSAPSAHMHIELPASCSRSTPRTDLCLGETTCGFPREAQEMVFDGSGDGLPTEYRIMTNGADALPTPSTAASEAVAANWEDARRRPGRHRL